MPFLGSTPAEQYKSLAKQTITGDGSTAYTLNQSVTNAYDMEVFINNVRQEPDTSYTATGNTITFTAAVTSSDSCYLIYQGQSVGSISPPANSVGTSQIANDGVHSVNIADTAVTHAKLHTNMDLSSKDVRIDAMDMSTGTNKMQLAIQSAVLNRFALRSTHTADYDNNPFIVYQPSSAGVQNDALVIGAEGQVRTQKNPHAVVQHIGGSNSTFSGQTAIFNTVHENVGNVYSTSNGRFTVPVAGRYLICANILSGDANNHGLYNIRKNGSNFLPGTNGWVQIYNHGNNNDSFATFSSVETLAANDYLDLYIHGSHYSFHWNHYNRMSVTLIG